MKAKNIIFLIFSFLLISCQQKADGSLSHFSSSFDDSHDEKPTSSAILTINPSSETILEDEKIIFLNQQTYNNIGNYATGNYSNSINQSEINTIDDFSFEHYRGKKSSQSFISLLPYYANSVDNTLPGALYNTSKIPNLKRMFMHYTTSHQDGDGAQIYYGANHDQFYSLTLPASQKINYIEIDFKNVSFFKITTSSQILNLIDIHLYYQKSEAPSNEFYLPSGEQQYRLNPTPYEGQLIPGVSKMDVPIDVLVNDDGTYIVRQTKTYTYYTYDYVLANPQYASDATMIDPIDVANYYIIFKQYPANYFSSASRAVKDAASYDLFKEDIRQVSKIYTRTDGYVNAVPYNTKNNQYVEFDIDIGNTYIVDKKVTRGVGRVVIFLNGFTTSNYDDSPVAVFSDDHYATFQEYLNIGLYGRRFNAQSKRTSYIWGSAKVLN